MGFVIILGCFWIFF